MTGEKLDQHRWLAQARQVSEVLNGHQEAVPKCTHPRAQVGRLLTVAGSRLGPTVSAAHNPDHVPVGSMKSPDRSGEFLHSFWRVIWLSAVKRRSLLFMLPRYP